MPSPISEPEQKQVLEAIVRFSHLDQNDIEIVFGLLADLGYTLARSNHREWVMKPEPELPKFESETQLKSFKKSPVVPFSIHDFKLGK